MGKLLCLRLCLETWKKILRFQILFLKSLSDAFAAHVYIMSLYLPQRSGEISYSGHQLNEFVPQKTSAYISQQDLHIAEMTVRETIDFSARCQGVASRTGTCLYRKTLFIKHSLNGSSLSAETDIMMEVSKREKDGGIIPDPEVDAYMKVHS